MKLSIRSLFAHRVCSKRHFFVFSYYKLYVQLYFIFNCVVNYYRCKYTVLMKQDPTISDYVINR